MDNQGTIATVALVVSLVALLVTTTQLLSQLFGTADGYRRCAESVVGIWQKERKRVFNFSELRFETTYVTPQIMLLAGEERWEAKESAQDIHYLHGFKADDPNCMLISETVHLRQLNPRHKRASLIGNNRHSKNGRKQDPEKLKHVNKVETRATQERNEMLVTWLFLLRELHALYTSYWPNRCSICKGSLDTIESSLASAGNGFSAENDPNRTDVGVIYRRWNWDFMPPEMVRPLAKTNIGDMVVLALRMGMQWRELAPQNGRLQASGNGYALSSTEVRGIGIILSLSTYGSQRQFPQIIPSRSADKMICGIIPGCPKLVKQDFSLIDDEGRGVRIDTSDGVLSKLGYPDDRMKLVRERNYSEIHNELIILLTSFLPLEGSTLHRHWFPEWKSNITSVFHYWEGRLALFRALGERIESLKVWEDHPMLQVWRTLQRLDLEFHDDFWARWQVPTCTFDGTDPQKKVQMIELCRNSFDYTTEALRICLGSSDNEPRPRYHHLVAAHIDMATHAIPQARNKLRDPEKQDHISFEGIRRYYSAEDFKYGPWFVEINYLIGEAYVRNIANQEHGIGMYFKRQGIKMKEEDAEAAWWLLMLRGICWKMATWYDENMGDSRVPSSMFLNKMPLWIT